MDDFENRRGLEDSIIRIDNVPAEYCAITPEEKKEVLRHMNEVMQVIGKAQRQEKGLEQGSTNKDVLNYFTERLCIPIELRDHFLRRLSLIHMCEPSFNFLEKFFQSGQDSSLKQMLIQGIGMVCRGEILSVPPSLAAIEKFCSEELLEKPEMFLGRLKNARRSRGVDVWKFKFEQEFDMIKNVVLQFLEQKAKEGRQAIREVEQVMAKESKQPFRQILSTFLEAEPKMNEWMIFYQLFQKIIASTLSVRLRNPQPGAFLVRPPPQNTYSKTVESSQRAYHGYDPQDYKQTNEQAAKLQHHSKSRETSKISKPVDSLDPFILESKQSPSNISKQQTPASLNTLQVGNIRNPHTTERGGSGVQPKSIVSTMAPAKPTTNKPKTGQKTQQKTGQQPPPKHYPNNPNLRR